MNDAKKIYSENSLFKEILKIEDFDIRYSESMYDENVRQEHPYVKMIDDNILGCYKIEKFIKEGFFLGSKMYATNCLDVEKVGRLTQKCKMKGVAEKYRQFEDYKELWESIFSQTSKFDISDPEDLKKYAKHFKLEGIFVKLNTGIRISSMLKIVIPTLVKRRMLDRNGIDSMPFVDFDEQKMYEKIYYSNYALIKSFYRTHVMNLQIKQHMESDQKKFQQNDTAIASQCKNKFI